MAEVKRLISVLGAFEGRRLLLRRRVLVVSDEPSCAYATFESPFLPHTLRETQVSLAKLGAPHDSILVDDLDRIGP